MDILNVKEINGFAVKAEKDDDRISWNCTFGNQEFPDFKKESPLAIKLMMQRGEISRHSYTLSKYGNGNVFFGQGFKRVRKVGRKVFPVFKWVKRMWFKDGRLHGDVFFRDDKNLSAIFCHFVRLECLSGYSGFFTKRTVEAMLRGKITNPQELVQTFFKTSYALTNVEWKAYLNYAECCRNAGCSFSDFADSMDRGDLDWLMRNWPKVKDLRLVGDVVKDCTILEKKMNPRWSEKRLLAEHNRNIKEILDRITLEGGDESYYSTPLSVDEKGLRGEVIGSKLRLLFESNAMQHCIFYNYRNDIEKGRYIAMSIELPVRCTVGMYPHSDGTVSVDQIRARYNASVPNDARDTIRSYISRHQQEICTLALERAADPSSLPGHGAADEDMPF